GMMPWVLRDVGLGDNVSEIGPGAGVTTDWLRDRVPALTCVEIDHDLASSLKKRLDGTNVAVVEGDATRMSFPDASFRSAVCFTMLHHVPSRELQDGLLAEAHRVLKPGGLFIGSDSTSSFRFRLFHVLDTCVSVEPDRFAARLRTPESPTSRSRSGRSTTLSSSGPARPDAQASSSTVVEACR